MKNYLINIILIVAIAVLAGCNRQKSFDDKCVEDAKTKTKQLCPQRVAEGLVIDSIVYDPYSRMYRYYYTLQDSVYTEEGIQNGREVFREKLKEGIVNSVELKAVKEHGVTFQYIYYGTPSKRVRLKYTFTPEEYGGKSAK